VIERGQVYRVVDSGLLVAVRRVARDRSWADVEVHDPNRPKALAWRKRQPLRGGQLPFAAELTEPA